MRYGQVLVLALGIFMLILYLFVRHLGHVGR